MRWGRGELLRPPTPKRVPVGPGRRRLPPPSAPPDLPRGHLRAGPRPGRPQRRRVLLHRHHDRLRRHAVVPRRVFFTRNTSAQPPLNPPFLPLFSPTFREPVSEWLSCFCSSSRHRLFIDSPQQRTPQVATIFFQTSGF